LNWARTPCGPIEGWPPCLRSAVNFCLSSGPPMIFLWGPRNVVFYNDAALKAVIRDRHPRAMGSTLLEVWPEMTDLVLSICEMVKQRGRPVAFDDAKLLLNRGGRLVSGYFTYSFSPLADDRGGVGRILNTFVETTGRVLSERRLRTLHEL